MSLEQLVMRILPFAIVLALGAAGALAVPARAPAPPPLSAEAAKVLAGRTAGPPTDCVHLRDVQSTRPLTMP